MSYRANLIERDFSGFIQSQGQEIGGMVIISARGRGDKPILNQSDTEILRNYGNPSAEYPSIFESVAYCRKAPCYIVSAIGDNALYGGVYVTEDAVTEFNSGVADPDTYDFDHPSGVVNNDISHVFFASSQWDSTWRVNITSQGGYKFKVVLYDRQNNNDVYITEYDYSLIREKNNFGKSLYYEDVFDENDYLIIKVNSNTTATTYNLSGSATYQLKSGSRGDTPTSAQITTAWTKFQSTNKYPLHNIMDVLGDHAGDVKTLKETYHPYAHCLSIIPIGNSVSQAVAYRSSLSIDSDAVSLYWNWTKIVDPYNNSMAWISCLGSVGQKYALMQDVFDGLSPAGTDENKHGGQLSDWRPVDTEYDPSDSDLQTLDEAQINPIIFDEIDGLKVYGDKTLQVSLSDTSYVGTRRLYNLIIKNVTRQVLKKQEFKNNDTYHRFKAKSMVDDFLVPILGGEYLREAYVKCDEENNGDEVLEQRKFILDIYVKATTNSQFVVLRLTKVSQTMVLAEMITT